MNTEQCLIAALDEFACVSRNMDAEAARLLGWRDELVAALRREPSLGRVQADGALGGHARAVRNEIAARLDAWGTEWVEGQLMRAFSDTMAEKVVLLVFGKVNAGKSSFCNFVAQRFAAYGKPVRYFCLENGQRIDSAQPFAEGATETTARVQGVELGAHLVLLDTPGLHSVTEENGALARRFTDAADAVLWLTSSAAPGQVQELEALAAELALGKPLLPVITRSDQHDYDEVDGELVQALRNKSGENRAQQEADVFARASQRLAASGVDVPMRRPVSVSALYARLHDGQEEAFDDAGFGRMYGELVHIAHEALAYKRDKPLRLVRNYLERSVLPDLTNVIIPKLRGLAEVSAQAARSLRQARPAVASAVLNDVLAALPELLDGHRADRDTAGLLVAVRNLCAINTERHVRQALVGYVSELERALIELAPQGLGGYEALTVDIEVVSGSVKRSLAASGGAALGGVLGSFFGPIGAVIGSTVGGLIGDAMGESFVETRHETQEVGVSYAQLQAKLEGALRRELPRAVERQLGGAVQAVEAVQRQVLQMVAQVESHAQVLSVRSAEGGLLPVPARRTHVSRDKLVSYEMQSD